MNELQELSKIDRIKLENFSCHTQAVERGVKCVSGAVLHHYEHDDQHGSILQGIESRNKHKNTYQKNCYDVSNLIGLDIAQGGSSQNSYFKSYFVHGQKIFNDYLRKVT